MRADCEDLWREEAITAVLVTWIRYAWVRKWTGHFWCVASVLRQ